MFIEVTRQVFNEPGHKVTINVAHIVYIEQVGKGAEILINNHGQGGAHIVNITEGYTEVQERIGAAGAKFG